MVSEFELAVPEKKIYTYIVVVFSKNREKLNPGAEGANPFRVQIIKQIKSF